MNLRQVEVFYAVYQQGSVSAAARSLGVSQPTVSKILKRLEDRIGFELFERLGGRLHPTQRAETLFRSVEPIYEQFSELQNMTRRLAGEGAGHLKFAMTPAFSLEVGPNAITQFSLSHPDATLEAETLHASEVSNRLVQGELDVGLVFDAPKHIGVQSRRLATTGFVCLSAQSVDPLPNGAATLDDLKEVRLIELNAKSVLGRRLQKRMGRSDITQSQGRLIVETYHLAKRLVRRGAGVAIVDAVTALSGDRSGLRFHAIPELERVGVDMVTPVTARTSGLVEALKANLIKELNLLTHSELHCALIDRT